MMDEPEEVLATIRRAYRYVVAYERRVLDAIADVDEALQERGFGRAKTAHPLHTHFPSRNRAPTKWAWDNVPNYARRFRWSFGEDNTAGSCWVLVDHVADTAFEKRDVSKGAEPQPLGEDLGPVESSRSILRWLVVSFAGSLPKERYGPVWNHDLSAELGATRAEVLFTEPTSAPRVDERPLLTLTRHCIDIAVLTDADALRRLFIDPLLASSGVP